MTYSYADLRKKQMQFELGYKEEYFVLQSFV